MRVKLEKSAVKALKKAPIQVQRKLRMWIDSINIVGLQETRKILSFHDEPLQGTKKDRRSIRLNMQWRAEYKIMADEEGNLIIVLEVHPHDY